MTPRASAVDVADGTAANARPEVPSAQRITFVISSLDAGGAERVLITMADWWIGHGRDVTVIHFAPVGEQPFYALPPAIREVRLGLRRTSRNPVTAVARNLRRIRRLRAAIDASRPEVVISFMDRTNVLTLLATVGWTIPVIVEEHADPSESRIGRVWSGLRNVTYRRASAVVALTPTSLRYFPRSIQERGRVIPNPVAIAPAARASTPSRDRGLILGMGRLGYEKGFDLLVQAFARIAPERPGWSVEIWGDGPERSRLEHLLSELGVAGRVRLPGWTSDPAEVMRRADLFVLSSRQEGFGNVLVEAMASGLPAISFDCPSGPREIIRDGNNGILVPAEDVPGLAAAMTRLIDDPSERERLAHAAIEVRDRFSVPTIMARWERLIGDVRSPGGRP